MSKQKKVYVESVDSFAGDVRLRSFISTITQELQSISSFPSLGAQFSATRQLERTSKKCRIQDNHVELQRKAYIDFIELNKIAKDIRLDLDIDLVTDARSFIEHALELYTKNLTGDTQNTLNLSLMLQGWRYGPGSSKGTMAQHFADKILVEKPTCTREALPYATMLRKINPHLRSFDGDSGCVFTVVSGSSLSSTPKNEETHRTICTEPVMNMALQLAAGNYIEHSLRTIGLDIRDQSDINFILADLGSKTRALATLDLKSASDLITIRLIELLWPPCWTHLFKAIRSPYTKIDGFDDEVELHMMSTMGNGFTFPMMTMTFLALIYANQSRHGNNKPFWINFYNTAVFGDDIIVPATEYESLCDVLQSAGLLINKDKSYCTGSFRESCGGDFYNGYNVTPFYVKSLTHDAQVYTAINQVLEWCGSHKLWLPHTLEYLLSLLYKPNKPFFVPVWLDSFSGIRSVRASSRYRYLSIECKQTVRKNDRIHPNLFTLMITGGYVRAAGEHGNRYMYTRRVNMENDPMSRYYIRDARLPKGYLDGQDRVIRDREKEQFIERLLDLII